MEEAAQKQRQGEGEASQEQSTKPDQEEHSREPTLKMTDHEKHTRSSPYSSHDARRSIFGAIAILLLLAGVIALIVYLIYRPTKPRFSITGAAVYELNLKTPGLISATMQFTIHARNPNKRVSIYYDRLLAFVSYRNQAITPPMSLPALLQKKQSTVVLSPVLGGAPMAIPVAEEVANGLAVDEAYGVVGLRVAVVGRLRYKAGIIRTAHYGVNVRCDVLVGLRDGLVGQVPLLASPPCKVDA